MDKRRRVGLVGGVCLWALVIGQMMGQSAERGAGEAVAFVRAQHLRHGMNTAIWFAQSASNYSVERLRSFTDEKDLALIASLGFDHIRLGVDAVPLTAWKNSTPDGVAFMGELDRAVRAALADGLAVIVDLHPEEAYKRDLLKGDSAIANFTALWGALAAHYGSLDKDRVFFEIMNEPEQTDATRWQGVQTQVVAAIRKVDTQHTLIATGIHWSGMKDLLQEEPLADTNVIYTFHDYEPFAFTHQGATWTGDDLKPLRRVPYPADLASVEKNMAQEPTLTGQFFVANYGLDHWDAAHIDGYISFAEKWGKAKGVPVYCGEFGVDREFAEPEARARWIRDTRVALEKHGIGWAMWDYRTNFGMVTKKDGVTTVDEGVVKALGVTPRAATESAAR